MHSFEVNIRICQPENSDVRRGEHFRGLTNPDVNRKRMHQLFCYMTLFSLFLVFISSIFIFTNFLKPDVSSAHKKQISSQLLFKFLKLLSDVQNNCIIKIIVLIKQTNS